MERSVLTKNSLNFSGNNKVLTINSEKITYSTDNGVTNNNISWNSILVNNPSGVNITNDLNMNNTNIKNVSSINANGRLQIGSNISTTSLTIGRSNMTSAVQGILNISGLLYLNGSPGTFNTYLRSNGPGLSPTWSSAQSDWNGYATSNLNMNGLQIINAGSINGISLTVTHGIISADLISNTIDAGTRFLPSILQVGCKSDRIVIGNNDSGRFCRIDSRLYITNDVDIEKTSQFIGTTRMNGIIEIYGQLRLRDGSFGDNGQYLSSTGSNGNPKWINPKWVGSADTTLNMNGNQIINAGTIIAETLTVNNGLRSENIFSSNIHGGILKTINLGPNISTENINIGHSKAAVRVNSSLAILGNLYLSGDFKTNGDAGEVGEVLKSRGPGNFPSWQAIKNEWVGIAETNLDMQYKNINNIRSMTVFDNITTDNLTVNNIKSSGYLAIGANAITTGVGIGNANTTTIQISAYNINLGSNYRTINGVTTIGSLDIDATVNFQHRILLNNNSGQTGQVLMSGGDLGFPYWGNPAFNSLATTNLNMDNYNINNVNNINNNDILNIGNTGTPQVNIGATTKDINIQGNLKLNGPLYTFSNPAFKSPGTLDQVLKSSGPNSPPYWSTISDLSSINNDLNMNSNSIINISTITTRNTPYIDFNTPDLIKLIKPTIFLSGIEGNSTYPIYIGKSVINTSIIIGGAYQSNITLLSNTYFNYMKGNLLVMEKINVSNIGVDENSITDVFGTLRTTNLDTGLIKVGGVLSIRSNELQLNSSNNILIGQTSEIITQISMYRDVYFNKNVHFNNIEQNTIISSYLKLNVENISIGNDTTNINLNGILVINNTSGENGYVLKIVNSKPVWTQNVDINTPINFSYSSYKTILDYNVLNISGPQRNVSFTENNIIINGYSGNVNEVLTKTNNGYIWSIIPPTIFNSSININQNNFKTTLDFQGLNLIGPNNIYNVSITSAAITINGNAGNIGNVLTIDNSGHYEWLPSSNNIDLSYLRPIDISINDVYEDALYRATNAISGRGITLTNTKISSGFIKNTVNFTSGGNNDLLHGSITLMSKSEQNVSEFSSSLTSYEYLMTSINNIDKYKSSFYSNGVGINYYNSSTSEIADKSLFFGITDYQGTIYCGFTTNQQIILSTQQKGISIDSAFESDPTYDYSTIIKPQQFGYIDISNNTTGGYYNLTNTNQDIIENDMLLTPTTPEIWSLIMPGVWTYMFSIECINSSGVTNVLQLETTKNGISYNITNFILITGTMIHNLIINIKMTGTDNIELNAKCSINNASIQCKIKNITRTRLA